MKVCKWCPEPVPVDARSDAIFCSKRCRQASHRFGAECPSLARALKPMRFAFADPPYPGKAWRYRGHPDFAGEVDHDRLVSRLQEWTDGWALSTSEDALSDVLAICRRRGVAVRVAAWFRQARGNLSARWPRNGWEPVIYAGGRRLPSNDQPEDALVYVARPRTTDARRVLGAKPSAFAYWMFQLLGARPGDQLDDLYPGSGGILRAWERFTQASRVDARRVA